MADELLSYSDLLHFHREVFLQDLERIVDSRLIGRIDSLHSEMLSHFDAIDQRFDRLESEYRTLNAERIAHLESEI